LNSKNIRILSFLDLDLLKNNINLLIEKIIQETKLTTYLEEESSIDILYSDLIMEHSNNSWNG
jgi:hypothetical protein